VSDLSSINAEALARIYRGRLEAGVEIRRELERRGFRLVVRGVTQPFAPADNSVFNNYIFKATQEISL
jgi:archaeosine-15-forming tRNA-guanine transglycosylase